MHLNEFFRQSKTKAGAFQIAKIRIGNLDERLKYPGDIIRIHADPRVFRQNNEFISLIVYDRGNENSPTFWRELNRIAQDVEKDLFQAQRIGPKFTSPGDNTIVRSTPFRSTRSCSI